MVVLQSVVVCALTTESGIVNVNELKYTIDTETDTERAW